ncbi:MAG: hypothetical protein WCK11_04075 [Candidatus Falkowbacteria bacterium]
MTNNRRTLGIIIIIIGLILLAVIIYFLIWLPNKPVAKPAPIVEQPAKPRIVATPKNPDKAAVIDLTPATKPEVDQETYKQLAKNFTERFGSFSNHANFQNMQDLKLFMTPRMQTWADAYVKKASQATSSGMNYYGITTQAVTLKVDEFNETAGTAKVTVYTQRREVKGVDQNAVVYPQAISLSLIKKGDTWKVDEAYWQK